MNTDATAMIIGTTVESCTIRAKERNSGGSIAAKKISSMALKTKGAQQVARASCERVRVRQISKAIRAAETTYGMAANCHRK
jgi:hypothetical protein